jgi:hypothetical protein
LPGGVSQHPAQKIAQPGDHTDCGIIPPLTHQAGDGVQGIEKKMRFNLLPQGMELGLHELLVESRGLGLL